MGGVGGRGGLEIIECSERVLRWEGGHRGVDGGVGTEDVSTFKLWGGYEERELLTSHSDRRAAS